VTEAFELLVRQINKFRDAHPSPLARKKKKKYLEWNRFLPFNRRKSPQQTQIVQAANDFVEKTTLAAESGKKLVARRKVMFVGEARVGKTTLQKAISQLAQTEVQKNNLRKRIVNALSARSKPPSDGRNYCKCY